MSEAPIRVLFVSTSNASRSILAEGLLRRAGGERFSAASAGTAPTSVHPLTLHVLGAAGIDHEWAASKSLERFIDQPFDYVITVCDDARRQCPNFPGADQSIHWGYKDPAGVEGDDAARVAAFERVFTDLSTRIRQFVVIAERRQPIAAE